MDALADQLWRTCKPFVFAYAVFAVAHFIAKIVVSEYKRWQAVKCLGHIPGPALSRTGRELVDNITCLHDWRTENIQKYPNEPLVSWMGIDAELICASPKMVKHILKDNFKNYTKPSSITDGFFKLFREWVGKDGIFVLQHGTDDDRDPLKTEHEKWYSQRKTAALLFSVSHFRDLMSETFADKCGDLTAQLEKVAKTGGVVDIQKKFFAFTMDSIQKIFFDRDVNSVGDQRSAYAENFDEAHRRMFKFVVSWIPYIVMGKYLPWPLGGLTLEPSNGLWLSLIRAVSSDARAFKRAVQSLTDETGRIIAEAKASSSDKPFLLSHFLKTGLYSDEHLSDVVLNMILAGRDTTACTLSWLLFRLTQHPAVQRAVTEEIDRVLEGRTPTFDDLLPSNMPYLNGVLYETLRLHPPVPFNQKIATERDVMPNGVVVPAGTRMTYMPYTMGRDPERYPEPLAFKPGRWIPFQNPNEYEFPVFQAGPRRCLGITMAQFESRFVVATLLQKFQFTLKAGEAEKIRYSLMVTMSICNNEDLTSHNLWVHPHLRKVT